MPNEHLATEETDTKPSRIHIKTKGSDIMDHVCSCTNRDESVVCALKELGSGVNLRGDEWEEHDGLVLFRGKVYVPLDAQLQHDIVEAHHDTPVTGHSGWWKTTELYATTGGLVWDIIFIYLFIYLSHFIDRWA